MPFIRFEERLKNKVSKVFSELKDSGVFKDHFETDSELKNFVILRLAQDNLLLYTMLTHGRYKVSPYHELLAKKLDLVERGEIKRLIIIAPPRFGKSWMSSVTFPTYYLAKNSHHKVMAVSYNSSLVSSFGRHARNMVLSDAYYNIWACTKEDKDVPFLSKDSKAVTNFSLTTGSEYIGQGLEGGVTGKGGHVILIDDWIRDYTDLKSNKMNNDWEYYNSTLYNRQEASDEKGNAAFVVVQTHWHKNDLIGRLKNEMLEGGDQWDILHIQAEATKNEFFDKSDFYYYD